MTSQCGICKYAKGGLTCAAYPRGIPEEILTGEVDHTEPYKGDHGIQFEEYKPNARL